jgi:integrase
VVDERPHRAAPPESKGGKEDLRGLTVAGPYRPAGPTRGERYHPVALPTPLRRRDTRCEQVRGVGGLRQAAGGGRAEAEGAAGARCQALLRHLVAGADTDIVALSELLGHSSIAVTNVYIKSNPERMMAAVEANPLAQHKEPSPGSGQT